MTLLETDSHAGLIGFRERGEFYDSSTELPSTHTVHKPAPEITSN
jgi:hypothetical protein